LKVLPILSLLYIPSSAQGILSATVRALGQQHKAAIYSLLAFYLVGIPLGLLFAFPFGLEVNGMWLGFMAAVCIQCVVFVRIIVKTDWQEMADHSDALISEFKSKHRQLPSFTPHSDTG
jgi:multidrug resistance protein, MATE family